MGNMTAFITGSTGFLGITLTQELVKAGWDVVAFHRPSSDLKELRKLGTVRFAAGDITDVDSLMTGMPEQVDAVFHTAGSVGFFGPDEDERQYQINVAGTRNVVDAALKRKAGRFIHTSTILTYDYSRQRRVDENTPPNKDSKYSYISTKYQGELEVVRATQEGMDTVILHPSVVFGAYDKTGWSQMFTILSRGMQVPFAPPGGANVCHMREVARAHINAYHKGRSGEHYILGGPDKSFREMIDAVAAILGKPGPRFTSPAWLFIFLSRLDNVTAKWFGRKPMTTMPEAEILCETCVCSSEKAERELDYHPAEFQVMLEDCYTWMKREGML
jgi:nucleoside-diphosphate-sugar epimerase